MTTTLKLDEITDFNPLEGYHGKLIHTDQMSVAHWTIKAGHPMQEHSHPHEQIVNMMEGEFELVVDGVSHHLVPGDIVVIPGGVSHSGIGITDCKIIDVWNPPRDDYREAQAGC